MAGELAKAGYYTQCVGKMHVHPLRNLMGFHNIELHDGYLGAYRRETVPYYEAQKIADDYFYWLKKEKELRQMLRIPVWNAIRGFPDRGFMKSLSIRQTGLRPGQLIFCAVGTGKSPFPDGVVCASASAVGCATVLF